MSVFKNICWWFFGGFITSLLWFIAGLVLSLTIIFIPFGINCFKVSGFIRCPFVKDIDQLDFGKKGFFKNLIWLCLVGWELTTAHLICAFFCTLTIIGIPFVKQHMKLAKLALTAYLMNSLSHP